VERLAELIEGSQALRRDTNAILECNQGLSRDTKAALEHSQALLRDTKATREQAVRLRRESAALKQESASERERRRHASSTSEQALGTYGQRGSAQEALAASVLLGRPRILLVDDYASWRRTVRSILQNHAELQFVGEGVEGTEAVDQFAKNS
jgi:PleD family two-component response regulator